MGIQYSCKVCAQLRNSLENHVKKETRSLHYYHTQASRCTLFNKKDSFQSREAFQNGQELKIALNGKDKVQVDQN